MRCKRLKQKFNILCDDDNKAVLSRSIVFTLFVVYCKWCAECRVTRAGRAYTGTVSTTSSGKECQSWSSDTPHIPNSNFTDASFPDGSVVAADNFCRNPDPNYAEGVWCYTMDPAVPWESCDVPPCGK